MSSPTPAERATGDQRGWSPSGRHDALTAAHRLEFALRDLELAHHAKDPEVGGYIAAVREAVDKAMDVLTRG